MEFPLIDRQDRFRTDELFVFDKNKSSSLRWSNCVNHCPYSVAFFFFLPSFCLKKNLSRKQTSPLVDGSSTIVCSRVFIFMCRTQLNGKFEREKEKEEEQEEKKKKVRYWRRTNEQDGGGGSSECSVTLSVYVYKCSLSLVLQLF